ncbi:MAG: periplasmic heavy metal sensor [Steroidobacteraceae bacterium]
MTPYWRHLLLTVALAGAAGFGGVWFGTRQLGSTAPPPDPLPAVLSKMARNGLQGLTDKQRTAISDIETHYLAERNKVRYQITNANYDLANALGEEMSFGPKTQASIQQLETTVGQLQKDTVLYVLALREVLTPDQKAVFDEKVVATLMTDPR